jgi:hypothetical protein
VWCCNLAPRFAARYRQLGMLLPASVSQAHAWPWLGPNSLDLPAGFFLQSVASFCLLSPCQLSMCPQHGCKCRAHA